MSYAIDKLGHAYYKLAIGEGDIRQRLCTVQSELLCVTIHDIPTVLHKEWEEIIHSLTKNGPLQDFNGRNLIGAIPNTVKKMRKKTASKIAQRIIEVYYKTK